MVKKRQFWVILRVVKKAQFWVVTSRVKNRQFWKVISVVNINKRQFLWLLTVAKIVSF